MVTTLPVFSVDITILNTKSEGLKLECPRNYLILIKNVLESKGIRLGDIYEVIEGTANLYSIIECSVQFGNFDEVCQLIKSHLTNMGYLIEEEVVVEGKDTYLKLHLINTSIYE